MTSLGPGSGQQLSPQAVLEDGLGAYLGRPARIAALEHRPLVASTHPIDSLCVTLASGERLRVIFKRPQPGEKLYGNEREVLIYRRLLHGQRFGAPALYASACDEVEGRYWLFLEDLGDTTLEDGDLEDWVAAVRWLAGMHAAYFGREGDLHALGCLMEHGPAYYRAVAEAARRNLELAGAGRALGRFDALMRRFDSLVAYLVGQPRTLVHGDLFAQNVIIQSGRRVRAIDWESAAIGLPVWDLARLLDGWEADRPALLAAYLDEFDRQAAGPLDRRGFHRTLARCEILNVLWQLRWSVEACRDAASVERKLNRMEAFWGALDEGRGDD